MEFRAHGNELAQEDRLDLNEEVIYGVLANVYEVVLRWRRWVDSSQHAVSHHRYILPTAMHA